MANVIGLDQTSRILIVDDESIIRQLLETILADIGTVEFASSGGEALTKVEQAPPDLVLLDVQMPDMDGYEVCRRLKSNPQTADVPIMFLTASIDAEDEARGLDLGSVDYIRKPIASRIVRRRIQNVLELRAANRTLRVIAATDPLTGAYNRRHFLEVCNAELHRSRRYDLTFSTAMLDIDHFKKVNDVFGHGIGDEALKGAVLAIQDTLRDEDTLGRWGGEEFAMIFPQTDIESGVMVAERIRQSIAGVLIETPKGPLNFTVSIGVADWRPDDDIDNVLSRADDALYSAKEGGRNQVRRSGRD